jgi:large subunit ribosomal protein L3
MAGHMGARKVTARNIEVVEVDQAKNIVLLKGAVPGGKNGLLLIESAA